jgi:hypothetical protein
MKIRMMNDFVYCRVHLDGLKSTAILYKPEGQEKAIPYETRKEFTCKCCGKETEIITEKNGVTTQNMTNFFNNCVADRLCINCYAGSDKIISGTADSIMAAAYGH